MPATTRTNFTGDAYTNSILGSDKWAVQKPDTQLPE